MIKKYQIIYADPPWDYTQIGKNYGKNITKTKDGFKPVVSAKDHYPTMKKEDIAKLPVKYIADVNCLLFMWITNPLLDVGFGIIKAWGFKYATVAFIWDKQAINPGSYTMSQCELCIVAKRGAIPKPRGERNVRQLISYPRGEHSKKPEEARLRIERMFPEQSKIELFARQKYPGWDSWGNEVDCDIDLIKEDK